MNQTFEELLEAKDRLGEIHHIYNMIKNRPHDSVYPLGDEYVVLKEISFANKIYKRGDKIIISEEVYNKNIKTNAFKKINSDYRKNTIEKIKKYIDFRVGTKLPEITFSEDYTKIHIYKWG